MTLPDIYGNRATSLSRLHAVLSRLDRANESKSLSAAWAEAGGETIKTARDIQRFIADVGRLADNAKAELDADSDQLAAASLVKLWPNIDALIALENIGVQFSGARGYLREPLLEALVQAHYRLRHNAPKAIPDDVLAQMRAELSKLVADIVTMKGVDDSLRMILLELLHQALRAVADYEALGVDGITRAFAAYAGIYAQHRDHLEAESGNSAVVQVKEATSKLGALIAWAHGNLSIINMLVGVGQLTAAAVSAFSAVSSGDAAPAINIIAPYTHPQLSPGTAPATK